MESSHEKRKVGRPRFLTDSVKKRIARERNRAAVFRTKVYLGDQYQRWMLKKEELGETHAGLAKILLDRFSTDSETESSSAQGAPYPQQGKASTPVTKFRKRHLCPPNVSEISSALSENTDTDAGPAVLRSSIQPSPQPATTSKQESPGPSHKRRKLYADEGSSFVNPFDVTIDVTEDSISDVNSDEEYEPSFNITLRPNNMFGLTEVNMEEEEFGAEETEDAGDTG